MYGSAHREISRKVASRINSGVDWKYLLAASEMPDWKSSGIGHHFKNTSPVEDIIYHVKESRRYFLKEGYSGINFQRNLGIAFHHIQDRMIQSEDRSLHNRYEAAISRILSSLVEFVDSEEIQGNDESLRKYLTSKMVFIKNPEEIVDISFRMCLSVAKLVANSPKPFKLGNKVKKNHTNMTNIFGKTEQRITKLNSQLNYYQPEVNKINNLIHRRRISKNIIYKISCLWLEYKKNILIKKFKNYYSESLKVIEEHKNKICNYRSELGVCLMNGYDKEYSKMLSNELWDGFKTEQYVKPEEIYEFFNSIETKLSSLSNNLDKLNPLFVFDKI